eukprot:scaffold74035_cov50-Phaeocystis_antarctica.AAC.2
MTLYPSQGLVARGHGLNRGSSLHLLLEQAGADVVDDGLDEADDGEDAADDGARGGEELVRGHARLLHDDGDGREVVLEGDRRVLRLGRGELVRVHRVLVRDGVAGVVHVLLHPRDDLEVVHVRVAGVQRGELHALDAVARRARKLGARLAKPELGDAVGRVDEVVLVVVLARVQHQLERAGHLAHRQVAGDAAALGAVHERACGGVERGRVVELEVGGPGERGAAQGCKGV